MKKIRVLEVLPSLTESNGIAAYILNYFRHIDKEKFEFTFLVVRDREDKSRFKDVQELGGKIVELYLDKNVFKYEKKIDEFFDKNSFDIVHCNMANIAFVILKSAKKHNIPVRIIHSHGTASSDRLLNCIRNDFLIKIGKKYATCFFACSAAAGKAMFGNEKFYIINNSIEYNNYSFDKKVRNKYRKELNVDDKIVIGTVGRYVRQKNQEYLIKIMNELVKENNNYVALIIGGGELTEKLTEMIKLYNLENNVFLLGSRRDANKLYNSMDLFVLTSFFEGLPVVGVEAQTNGLPCIFSDKITEEVAIHNEAYFLPINNEDIKNWVTKIQEITKVRVDSELNQEYDITYATKKFESILTDLIKPLSK